MTIHIINKKILYLIIPLAIIQFASAMSTEFTFTKIDEAILLIPPVPWKNRDCQQIVRLCRHILNLCRKPTTQIPDIERFITFTNTIINETCLDRFGNYYPYEKHRLTCYKKLMLWQIEKREQ